MSLFFASPRTVSIVNTFSPIVTSVERCRIGRRPQLAQHQRPCFTARPDMLAASVEGHDPKPPATNRQPLPVPTRSGSAELASRRFLLYASGRGAGKIPRPEEKRRQMTLTLTMLRCPDRVAPETRHFDG